MTLLCRLLKVLLGSFNCCFFWWKAKKWHFLTSKVITQQVRKATQCFPSSLCHNLGKFHLSSVSGTCLFIEGRNPPFLWNNEWHKKMLTLLKRNTERNRILVSLRNNSVMKHPSNTKLIRKVWISEQWRKTSE